MREALKAVGAALAVIALCTPLIFWTVDEAQPTSLDLAQVSVPPTVLVPTTAPETTTTTARLAKPEPVSTTTSTTVPSITIAVAGDVLPHDSILKAVQDPETGTYDFWSTLVPIAPYLRGADYTVVNLETRLAGPEKGYGGYPTPNSPTDLAYALRIAGVDLAATANNHSLDMGWEGIVGTLDRLDMAGIAHVGTYRSALEKRVPLVVDIKGIKVGFLNYAQGLNGLTLPEEHAEYAVNTIDLDAVSADVVTARLWGAEIVIALLHYGEEYERKPSEEQLDISQEMLSRGVDVIMGSHPHVVQPIAHVVDYGDLRAVSKYAAYSLGNFLTNQRWRYSDSGLVAYIHIEDRGLRPVVAGVSYLPVYVQRATVGSAVEYRVLPVLPAVSSGTDIPLTKREAQRMTQIWEEMRQVLYRPDENISPLRPADIGL